MIRRTAWMMLLLLAATVFGLTAATLSGSTSLWFGLDPLGGEFDTLNLGFDVEYTLGEVALSTDGLLFLPGTWVWEGFSAVGRFGAYALTTSILCGPSTTDYLYAEAIVEMSIAGIDMSWYAAQLSDAVLGGPADGWALRIAGFIGSIDLIAISEFGARIEDDEFDGITIVHAATGEERHYTTDPLVPGKGFTGQKVTLLGVPFCCADIDANLYFTCDGFQKMSFDVTGIEVERLPWLSFDVDLTFELEEKDLMLVPRLSLGEVACVDVYAELDWDVAARALDGICVYGFEVSCVLGPVTVRDVVVLDLNHYAITTQAYGSTVERVVDAIADGHDIYPDYWEVFSMAYHGDGCCSGDLTFLFDVYFDEASTSLFDWAMTHVEATIPLAEAFAFTLAMEAIPAGIDALTFGFHVAW